MENGNVYDKENKLIGFWAKCYLGNGIDFIVEMAISKNVGLVTRGFDTKKEMEKELEIRGLTAVGIYRLEW